jgi:hypothetical protein
MKFIELTVSNAERKCLVNVSLVTEVYENKEKGSSLYFLNSNADHQAFIKVKESYEDVKALIESI